MKKFFLILLIACLFGSAQAQRRDMPKNEVKVSLLSIFSGSTKVTYERLVRDYQSVEFTFGIIGLGVDMLKDSDPKGTAWRIAYKFILPDKRNANNQMCGFYIKPELCYSSYSYNYTAVERLDVDRFALMGVAGYDLVWDWFVFDVYCGLGFGFGESNHSNYHHGFIGWSADNPTAFTAGFRVGAAF